MSFEVGSGKARMVPEAPARISDPAGSADPDAKPRTDFFQMRAVKSLSETEHAALERLAWEYGQSPDAYLAMESDRHCFLAPDHSAAMSVVVSGRYIHIPGGILAPEQIRRQLIADLTAYSRSSRNLVAVYSVGEIDRPFFEEAGWEVSKFGEETWLKLSSLSWSGKPFEWVRRQSNYCQRAGLVCREVHRSSMDAASWQKLSDELFEVQRDDLKDRAYSEELNMLLGKLEPHDMGRRRLFVAEDSRSNRVEAFVVATPMRGGRAWGLEMFRKRNDCPRGTIPFLLKWIIDKLKSEGVEEVSLCMLLWKGTRTFQGKRTSPLVRWGLALAYHIGNPIYHTKGLAHFKTRFRPELSNIYTCVTPGSTILSCINFLYIVGAFSFSPRNMLRNFWNHLTQRKGGGN
jgi:phosphatidylglycerol lysyltransferase